MQHRKGGPPLRQPGRYQPYPQQQQRKTIFDDYCTLEEANAGVANGRLIAGQLFINKANTEEAFVSHPNADADVLIGSRVDRNRALNDDEVAVLVKTVASWRVLGFSHSSAATSQQQQQQQPATVESVIAAGQATFAALFPGAARSATDQQRLLQSNADPCQPLPTDRVQRVGQVVAIVSQLASRRFVGRVKPRLGEQKIEVFEPLDTRQPRCNVPRAELARFCVSPGGDLRQAVFVAELDHWAPGFFMPKARICGRLGERVDGQIDLELETRVILEQLGIPESSESVSDAMMAADGVNNQEVARRRDFRDPSRYCVFTVDKELARDLDDAVHYRALDGGDCEIGVHIADVSHYVRPGSQVDKTARVRGASTYLEQRTCHMLPQRLSEDLCSMNPCKDKLAFSIVWRIDSVSGTVRSTWMGKSVVRSCCQLSYPQAQHFIDGHSDLLKSRADVATRTPEAPHTVQSIADSVRQLHRLATKLLERRIADGALIIDPPRLKFRYSNQAPNAPPVDFQLEEQSDGSNSMIEELMVLANCSVALKLRDSTPKLAFLRQQLPPSRRALQNLCRNSAAFGVQFDVTSSGNLQASIEQATRQLDPEMQLYLRKISVSPMPRAHNFCIGSDAQRPQMWRHYSLNVPVYATFTSPIRRYADIVVHRQLCAALCAEAGQETDESTKSSETVATLSALASHSNKKEKDANEACRRSTELHFAAFQLCRGPLDDVGRVVAVLDKAVDLFLVRCGLQGRLYMEQQKELQEFKFESDMQGCPQLILRFKGCNSDRHQLTLSTKSRVDLGLTSCQLVDGRPLKLTMRLKPPTCELCACA